MARTVNETTRELDQETIGEDQNLEPVSKEAPNVFKSDADAGAFMNYICGEIKDIRDGQDRKGLEEKWNTWRRQRIAEPESKVRNTPWVKSSNVEPPLTMQKVQTIYAKLIAAFGTKKPPVSVEPFNGEDRDIADSLERLFKGLASNRYGLDINRVFKKIAYDLVSLGTQVVKVPFKVEQWNFKREDDTGTQDVSYVRKRGPEIQPIRLEDFFTRPYWKDVQRAPWIATRSRLFYHELKQFESQNIFKNVDLVLGSPITKYDDNLEAALERAGVAISSLGGEQPNREFEIYECNVFWDVDGDGYPEDVIAWVEPDTMTLLRAQFNPLSIRDTEVFTYLEDPASMYGIGVCRMVEGLQEEVSALHRMRLDNTQLSMLKMFVAKRGAGIASDEEFYPFKLLLLDDPAADFRAIDFPDMTQGAVLGEQLVKEYADRVTGANDYMAGFNDKITGSNSTAAGTTFLAGQANSILNSLLENTEQSMSMVYMIALYQMIANRDLVDLGWMDDADRENISKVFELQVEELPTKFQFTVQTTDINKTDESRKQNFLMVAQLYNQYGQTALQTIMTKINPQLANNPEAQELLTSMYVGQAALMSKMIEFFDVGNPDDFVPFTEQLKLQMRAMDMVRKEQTAVMRKELSNARDQTRGQAGAVGPAGGGSEGTPGGFGGGLEPNPQDRGIPPMAGGAGPQGSQNPAGSGQAGQVPGGMGGL